MAQEGGWLAACSRIICMVVSPILHTYNCNAYMQYAYYY